MINTPSRVNDDCKKDIVAVFRRMTVFAPAMKYKSRLSGDVERLLNLGFLENFKSVL
jgi:hypothetical protein